MTCYESINIELYYVNNVQGYWAVSIVDAAGSVGSHTSIALDSQGSPHVSYNDQTNHALKYARYRQGFWETHQVDGSNSGYFTNVALDPSDHPVIVYQGYDKKGSLELKHAELLAEPEAPRRLEAAAGEGEVTLSWRFPWQDHGYDVTGYNVYRSEEAGKESLLITVGDVWEVTDQTALEGTYTYRVAAVNAVGVGMKTGPVTVTVEEVASDPGVPRNLDVDAGNGTVTLNWDPPDDDGGTPVTGYKVYRGITEGAELLLATLGDVTTYVDDNVTNGQTYYYRVSALNAVGEGSLTDSEHATPTAEGGIDDDDEDGSGIMMYVILAVVVIAAVSVIIVFVLKRKPR
ncbi:MAG TPA: fibronectin type III domain-containing protein, partial [Methanomassiliicoccales archaeon]|nr:fibronectin type III domain-containing protein [Methanomassiliicoccales archaeon]